MPAGALLRLVARRVLSALGVLLAAGTLACLAALAALQAIEAARLAKCKNNLKQIELALHNYADTHGTFPPAVTLGPDGKPWHSWRVLILPFFEVAPQFHRYSVDEPWDGPNNRLLFDDPPPQYRCPVDSDEEPGAASYLAVTGDRSMWPPAKAVRWESLTAGDVPDGLMRTLHVVEVSESGVRWSEPRDLAFDAMAFGVNSGEGAGVRSLHAGGLGRDGMHPAPANVAFSDGAVRRLDERTPPDTLKSLLLRDDGGPKSEEWP